MTPSEREWEYYKMDLTSPPMLSVKELKLKCQTTLMQEKNGPIVKLFKRLGTKALVEAVGYVKKIK